MQELLKRLTGELQAAYFKPNGFKKQRQRFRRHVDTVIQEIEFQSSSWNSPGGSVTFYINLFVGFADIPMGDGKPALTGQGRIDGLVPDAPKQFDLTSMNYECLLKELLGLLPQALAELPKHYEDIRSRALVDCIRRFHCQIVGGNSQALKISVPGAMRVGRKFLLRRLTGGPKWLLAAAFYN